MAECVLYDIFVNYYLNISCHFAQKKKRKKKRKNHNIWKIGIKCKTKNKAINHINLQKYLPYTFFFN